MYVHSASISENKLKWGPGRRGNTKGREGRSPPPHQQRYYFWYPVVQVMQIDNYLQHPANRDSYIRAKQVMQCSMFYVAEFSAAVQHPVPHSVQRVQSQRQPPPEPALAAPGLQQVLHHGRRPTREVGEQFLLCMFTKRKLLIFSPLKSLGLRCPCSTYINGGWERVEFFR